MHSWYYCQQVWVVLSELYLLLCKMEESHSKNIAKMFSPKMLGTILKQEHMQMTVVAYFQMATNLGESYGYLRAIIETGVCPQIAQLKNLVEDHLVKMEEYHHLMIQSIEETKKKHKDKKTEEMMKEMMAEHRQVSELITSLKKFTNFT